MDFSDKVVIITGASSGIGAACAIKFATLNAKVALVGRNEENLRTIASQCTEVSKFDHLQIIADVSIDEDVQRIVETTIARYGQIDVLVNNAGIAPLGSTKSGIELFDRIHATNIRGTYLLSSLAIPHLIKTKGNIVNISSILSTLPCVVFTPYCISKAGMDMFTKCLALELAADGVRVNTVNPGPVRTEIFKRAGITDTETFFKQMEEKLPLKKIPDGSEIADAVTYLASSIARSVTGICHVVDGGMLLGDEKLF